MANEQNLIPMKERTASERRELAKKAGKASGKKRRERKTFREDLLTMLKTGDVQENILAALLDKAMQGDVKAFETIRDSIGEKPKDMLEVDSTVQIVVDIDED